MEKKIFSSFHYSHIRQNSPAPPGGHVFRPINMAWRNLIEVHPRNISTKLLENRPDTFRKEDFLSFHYSHIRQNSPAPPGGHVFRPINMAWRNQIEGHPRNISTKLFENRPDTSGGEDFLSYHYSHIRQNSPAPLANDFAPFLMPPDCHVFQPNSMHWTIFVESHPRKISTNLYWNLTRRFRGEYF